MSDTVLSFFENKNEILILSDSYSWWRKENILLHWIASICTSVCEIRLGSFKRILPFKLPSSCIALWLQDYFKAEWNCLKTSGYFYTQCSPVCTAWHFTYTKTHCKFSKPRSKVLGMTSLAELAVSFPAEQTSLSPLATAASLQWMLLLEFHSQSSSRPVQAAAGLHHGPPLPPRGEPCSPHPSLCAPSL